MDIKEMHKASKALIDYLGHMRSTTHDADHFGFHLVNISPLGVRDQLVIMAESIIEHTQTLAGDSDGQYTLF